MPRKLTLCPFGSQQGLVRVKVGMKDPKIEHITDHPHPGTLWASNEQDVGISEQNEQKSHSNEQ